MAPPTVVVAFERWGAIAADLIHEAEALRRATAGAILANAQANAPEVSGALKASGYLLDQGLDTYADAVAAATAKNPDLTPLPPVDRELNTTIVAFAAPYAAINEYYVGPASPGAHPFLTPAALGQQAAFDREVERLGGKIT